MKAGSPPSAFTQLEITMAYHRARDRIASPLPAQSRKRDGSRISFGAVLSEMRECLPPYLRRSAIIARMMGPPSRSEISGVAMVTITVAILVHSQLSIIGKDKRQPLSIQDILLSAKWRLRVSTLTWSIP